MSATDVFSIELDPSLHAAFVEATAAAQRPAADVVRELMTEFIERQRTAPDYENFLRIKVGVAMDSAKAGRLRDHGDVEKEFAARRATLSVT